MNLQERTVTESISTAELERRWSKVREMMRREQIDFLVMQNNNETLGGYVRWFTDIPGKGGSPYTVIFPVDDEMTTIMHGGSQAAGDFGPPAWAMRGVKNRLTAPYFPTLYYSWTYDAELAVNVLREKGKGATIGIVGKGMIPTTFLDNLRKDLSESTFVEATDLVDRIKAIKSDEELALIRRAALLQDEAMEYAKKAVRPGRKDSEIVADIIHKTVDLGSEDGSVMAGSGPVGKPVGLRKRHFQNRELKEGEQFTLMIEVNGPGGMYAEIGRIFFVGKVPAVLEDAMEVAKGAQDLTVRLLGPGVQPGEIWRANNEFLMRNGYVPETRLHAHGQGYDLVERPALREDEPMKLKARMNIAVHPIASNDRVWVWVCDNYLITDSGVSPCLHKTSKDIIAL